MIKKYSKNRTSELEFYFNLYKQAQADDSQWQQALQYMQSAKGQVDALQGQFKESADKISGAHQKLEAGGVTIDDVQKAFGEGAAAGAQEPESVRQASGLKNKIRELKKFARKYKSLKTDKHRMMFLKRSGVIDREGLMKLGMELEGESLIKKGFRDEGSLLLKIAVGPSSVDRMLASAMRPAIAGSVPNPIPAAGGPPVATGGGGPAAPASQLPQNFKPHFGRPVPVLGGTPAPATATGTAPATAPGTPPATAPATATATGTAPATATATAPGTPPATATAPATGTAQNVAGGADEAAAAGGSWWSRLTGGASKLLSGAKSWISRGLKFLGKVFRYLGVIIELIRGMAGLAKAIYNLIGIIGVASEVGISPWSVLSSADSISSKIPEFQTDPEKLGKLGYLAESGKAFWEGIVAVILTPIFAALQYGVLMVSLAVGAAAAPTGPLAPIVSIAVGMGLGTIVEWLRSWIESIMNEYMTAEYVAVAQQISQIISSGGVQQVEQAPQMQYAPIEYAPAAARAQEGAPARGSARAAPAPASAPASAPVPTSRREERAQRRGLRRQERQERRSVRREDRTARRTARRAARSGVPTATAAKRLEQFIKLANELDNRDLVEEADLVDYLIYQLAK